MLTSPWQYSDKSIRILTRMTKIEYFSFVESAIGSRQRRRELNLFAECLMFLLKVSHDVPYEMLGALFEVNHNVAMDLVYRQCLHYFKNNLNIPSILQPDGSANIAEVSKLLRTAYNNTEPYYKTFVFEDPTGQGRRPVFINVDATYLFTQNSSDIEMQKSFFYAPKFAHIIKWLTFTDLSGKIIGICPACTSQTPASGDAHIMAAYINLEDNSNSGNYVRTLLSGNSEYFVVLVVDAGFVARVPNAPRSVRNLPTLVDVCNQVGAIILHTSNGQYTYHLRVNAQGNLEKVIPRAENRPTMDEVAVKFSRLLRKPQEQSFGSLKRMYKMLGAKSIPNSLLQPLPRNYIQRFGVSQELANVPKITFFATSICSLYNQTHAGYHLLFFDTPEQQIEAARSFLQRMNCENPLLHDIFNINFESRVRGQWQELTIRDFNGQQNPINFPRITIDEVNPKAVGLCSGPHALFRGQGTLTYISQLFIKENNLSGGAAENILNSLPNFHKVQHLTVATRPAAWDEALFGPFVPVTFVRSEMPPSNRSASSRANFHMIVIAFSDQPSDRLGLFPPFDRIRFWYCHTCQSLNGLCSMDRHLAAGIIALSCPEFFKPTAKNISVLNPVALPTSQCLVSMPRGQQSRDIPQQIGRRSRDRRNADSNPLYVYGAVPQARPRARGGTRSGSRGARTGTPAAITTTAPRATFVTTTVAPASLTSAAVVTATNTGPPATVPSVQGPTSAANLGSTGSGPILRTTAGGAATTTGGGATATTAGGATATTAAIIGPLLTTGSSQLASIPTVTNSGQPAGALAQPATGPGPTTADSLRSTGSGPSSRTSTQSGGGSTPSQGSGLPSHGSTNIPATPGNIVLLLESSL